MSIRYSILFFVCSAFVCFQDIKAQEVLWASRILGYSSEYRPSQFGDEYRAIQVLHEPNKLPGVGDSPCAWTPALPDGLSEEWIKVGFEKPLSLKQLAIAENFNAGALVRVYAYDVAGREYLVGEGAALAPGQERGRLLRLFPDIGSSVKVDAVKLVMRPSKVPGYNQIDAIGISSSLTPVQVGVKVAADAPARVAKEDLGKNINGKGEQVAPVISPDGNTLYFTRSGHPGNVGSPDRQDVWYAVLQKNGTWGEAVNIKAPINTADNNAAIGISPAGKTLYLLNTYLPDGSMGGGLSKSFLTSAGWSKPVACEIRNYYNLDASQEVEFAVSPKGNVLIMAVYRRDTRGRKDLYVSFLSGDGTWSEPANMGAALNTADTEGAPFLAPDNKTLYFTSFGHRGYGSGDIFVSRRLDDTWLNWSKPENLGPGINSPYWDGYFSIPASGEYAYLSSNENVARKDHLYRVRLYPSVKPEALAVVSGAVTNADSKIQLKARLLVDDARTNEAVDSLDYDPATGEYKMLLPLGRNYRLTALTDGFLPYTESLDFSNDKGSVIRRADLRLVPLIPGKKIALNQIYFAQSSPVIDSLSLPELQRILQLMKKHPDMEILLEGHTDNQGDFQKNLILSEERVAAVREFLISRKIDGKRIQIKAWGASRPVGNNLTEDSRKRNRRVEFTILKI